MEEEYEFDPDEFDFNDLFANPSTVPIANAVGTPMPSAPIGLDGNSADESGTLEFRDGRYIPRGLPDYGPVPGGSLAPVVSSFNNEAGIWTDTNTGTGAVSATFPWQEQQPSGPALPGVQDQPVVPPSIEQPSWQATVEGQPLGWDPNAPAEGKETTIDLPSWLQWAGPTGTWGGDTVRNIYRGFGVAAKQAEAGDWRGAFGTAAQAGFDQTGVGLAYKQLSSSIPMTVEGYVDLARSGGRSEDVSKAVGKIATGGGSNIMGGISGMLGAVPAPVLETLGNVPQWVEAAGARLEDEIEAVTGKRIGGVLRKSSIVPTQFFRMLEDPLKFHRELLDVAQREGLISVEDGLRVKATRFMNEVGEDRSQPYRDRDAQGFDPRRAAASRFPINLDVRLPGMKRGVLQEAFGTPSDPVSYAVRATENIAFSGDDRRWNAVRRILLGEDPNVVLGVSGGEKPAPNTAFKDELERYNYNFQKRIETAGVLAADDARRFGLAGAPAQKFVAEAQEEAFVLGRNGVIIGENSPLAEMAGQTILGVVMARAGIDPLDIALDRLAGRIGTQALLRNGAGVVGKAAQAIRDAAPIPRANRVAEQIGEKVITAPEPPKVDEDGRVAVDRRPGGTKTPEVIVLGARAGEVTKPLQVDAIRRGIVDPAIMQRIDARLKSNNPLVRALGKAEQFVAELTPESKANLSAHHALTMVTELLQGTETVADAKRVMQMAALSRAEPEHLTELVKRFGHLPVSTRMALSQPILERMAGEFAEFKTMKGDDSLGLDTLAFHDEFLRSAERSAREEFNVKAPSERSTVEKLIAGQRAIMNLAYLRNPGYVIRNAFSDTILSAADGIKTWGDWGQADKRLAEIGLSRADITATPTEEARRNFSNNISGRFGKVMDTIETWTLGKLVGNLNDALEFGRRAKGEYHGFMRYMDANWSPGISESVMAKIDPAKREIVAGLARAAKAGVTKEKLQSIYKDYMAGTDRTVGMNIADWMRERGIPGYAIDPMTLAEIHDFLRKRTGQDIDAVINEARSKFGQSFEAKHAEDIRGLGELAHPSQSAGPERAQEMADRFAALKSFTDSLTADGTMSREHAAAAFGELLQDLVGHIEAVRNADEVLGKKLGKIPLGKNGENILKLISFLAREESKAYMDGRTRADARLAQAHQTIKAMRDRYPKASNLGSMVRGEWDAYRRDTAAIWQPAQKGILGTYKWATDAVDRVARGEWDAVVKERPGIDDVDTSASKIYEEYARKITEEGFEELGRMIDTRRGRVDAVRNEAWRRAQVTVKGAPEVTRHVIDIVRAAQRSEIEDAQLVIGEKHRLLAQKDDGKIDLDEYGKRMAEAWDKHFTFVEELHRETPARILAAEIRHGDLANEFRDRAKMKPEQVADVISKIDADAHPQPQPKQELNTEPVNKADTPDAGGKIYSPVELFQMNAGAAFKLTPEEVDANVALIKANTDYLGITPDQWMRRYVKGIGYSETSDPMSLYQPAGNNSTTNRGSVTFEADGRAVIRAMTAPDVSTLSHELGHIFRRTLKPNEARDAELVLGVENGQWDIDHEEAFASQFEAYLREGRAPTSELDKVFSQFRRWLVKIYRTLTGSQLGISNEMRDVFDRMLGQEVDFTRPEPLGKIDTAEAARSKLDQLHEGLRDLEYRVSPKYTDDSGLPTMKELFTFINPGTGQLHANLSNGTDKHEKLMELYAKYKPGLVAEGNATYDLTIEDATQWLEGSWQSRKNIADERRGMLADKRIGHKINAAIESYTEQIAKVSEILRELEPPEQTGQTGRVYTPYEIENDLNRVRGIWRDTNGDVESVIALYENDPNGIPDHVGNELSRLEGDLQRSQPNPEPEPEANPEPEPEAGTQTSLIDGIGDRGPSFDGEQTGLFGVDIPADELRRQFNVLDRQITAETDPARRETLQSRRDELLNQGRSRGVDLTVQEKLTGGLFDLVDAINDLPDKLAEALNSKSSAEIPPVDQMTWSQFVKTGGHPWRITRAHYIRIFEGFMTGLGQKPNTERAAKDHEESVAHAVNVEKQPVRDIVLLDYPEIEEKAKRQTESMRETIERVMDESADTIAPEELAAKITKTVDEVATSKTEVKESDPNGDASAENAIVEPQFVTEPERYDAPAPEFGDMPHGIKSLVEQAVSRTSRPLPTIVVGKLKLGADGKWIPVHVLPGGWAPASPEQQRTYFVFQDKNGQTHGKRYASRDAAFSDAIAIMKLADDEHRKVLIEMWQSDQVRFADHITKFLKSSKNPPDAGFWARYGVSLPDPDPIATMTMNDEIGLVELRFDEYPDDETQSQLRASGFRWSTKDRSWWARNNNSDAIVLARRLSGQTASILSPEPTIPETTPETQESNAQQPEQSAATEPKRPGDGSLPPGITGNIQEPEHNGRVEQPPIQSPRTDQAVDGRGNQERDDTTTSRSPRAGTGIAPDGGSTGTDATGSTGRVADYVIADIPTHGMGTAVEHYDANIAAITLLKKLETEGRQATPEEQAVLAKYVGWGSLPQAFSYDEAGRQDSKETGGRWSPYAEKRKNWYTRIGEVRQLLTAEEYAAARASSLNAHYTNGVVVKAYWDAMRRIGFTGGRVLDPSSGHGNFEGAMPSDMVARSTRYMVELDPLTSRLAKQLYPNAIHYQMGYQETLLPDNFMDAASSNVPFGSFGVSDRKFSGGRRFLTQAIHDYFFAKALDHVRPGGIVGFITSRFTLDKKDTRTRKYLAERADFIGAIRMPDTTFSKNAGTDVVTDMIFLRKRASGDPEGGESWVETGIVAGNKGEHDTNEYFVQHPEMVIGTPVVKHGMYGDSTLTYTFDGNLSDALAAAVAKLPEGVYLSETETPKGAPISQKDFAPEGSRDGSYVRTATGIKRVSMGSLVDVNVPKETATLIENAIMVKEAARAAIKSQTSGNRESLNRSQSDLNTVYDTFTKAHGALNSVKVKQAMKGDPELPLLLGLERIDPVAKSWVKAPIFSEIVSSRADQRKVTAADARDALSIALNESGVPNITRMSELLNKSEDEVMSELGDLVFVAPNGKPVIGASYLGGNVRLKLAEAREAARLDPKYQRNVDALTKVQPPILSPGNIIYRLGQTWIPTEAIKSYFESTFGGEWDISKNDMVGAWNIVANLQGNRRLEQFDARGKFDTVYMDLVDLARETLNMVSPKITWRSDLTGRREIDQVGTTLVRQKQADLIEHFKSWAQTDLNWAQRLADIYNNDINNSVVAEFSGEHLTLPGSNPNIQLRQHQKNVIWKILQGGNVYMAHEVGAGKTYAMVAAAMEMKRMGLRQKPMITTINSAISGFTKQFMDLYPNANILVADEKTFGDKAKRNKFMTLAATGNYDAIVMPHSSFGLLPVSKEVFNRFIGDQIEMLRNFLIQLAEQKANSESTNSRSGKKGKKGKKGGGGNRIVKEIEAAIKRFETMIKDRMVQTEDIINFEDLGIDALFVDEADTFKNLMYVTKMDNSIKGLGSSSGSSRALDLYMKTQWLNNKQGGGIVFASGTPISNSMVEQYTNMRYLQPEVLQHLKIESLDAWAAMFAEPKKSWEKQATGNYKVVTRLANWRNLAELMQHVNQSMDLITQDKLIKLEKEGKAEALKRPKISGGKPTAITVKASPDLLKYTKWLAFRAGKVGTEANLANRQSYEAGYPVNWVIPEHDNMLAIGIDARKSSTDMRVVDPTLPNDPKSKLNASIEKVFEIWKRTTKTKSAQVVFSDFGVPPSGVDRKMKFSTYLWMRDELIRMGVPAEEIAIATQFKKEHLSGLFDRVNNGDVRVIIGSTQKLGIGVNINKKLIAAHHIDVPERPRDMEQRDGRIVRQGNENKEVEIYNYLAQGTYDERMWQILREKGRTIGRWKSGDYSERTVVEDDSFTMGAAELSAIASGDPKMLEYITLGSDIATMKLMREASFSEHDAVLREYRFNKRNLERIEGLAKTHANLINRILALDPKGWRYVVSGNTIGPGIDKTPVKALKDAIDPMLKNLGENSSVQNIGQMDGIPVNMAVDVGPKTISIDIGFGGPIKDIVEGAFFTVIIDGKGATTTEGIAQRLINLRDHMIITVKSIDGDITDLKADVAAGMRRTESFQRFDESALIKAEARHAELHAELGVDKDQDDANNAIANAIDTTQGDDTTKDGDDDAEEFDAPTQLYQSPVNPNKRNQSVRETLPKSGVNKKGVPVTQEAASRMDDDDNPFRGISNLDALAEAFGDRGLPDAREIASSNLGWKKQGLEAILDGYRQFASERKGDVAGRPQFTGAERSALDEAMREWQRELPNMRNKARAAGKAQTDFSLLAYDERTGADLAMSAIVPFSFWQTRQGRNMAIRMLNNPQLLLAWWRWKKAQQELARRKGDPKRVSGMVQVPGTDMYADPVGLMVPFANMIREDANDEIANRTLAQTMLDYGSVIGMRPSPVIDFLMRYTNVMVDGQPGTDEYKAKLRAYGRESLRGMLPSSGLVQAVTGAAGIGGPAGVNPENEVSRLLGGRDTEAWDGYRINRSIRDLVGEQQNADPRLAVAAEVWVQKRDADGNLGQALRNVSADQIAKELRIGPKDAETVANIIKVAAARATKQRAISVLSSQMAGIRAQQVPEGERTYIDALRNKRAAAYDPATGYGSRADVNRVTANNPVLTAAQAQYASIPGEERNAGYILDRLDRERVNEAFDAAIDAAIRKEPWNRKEVREIENARYDALKLVDRAAKPEGGTDALAAAMQLLTTSSGIRQPGQPYRPASLAGASPTEAKEIRQNEILRAVYATRPTVDQFHDEDGGIDFDAYNKAKAEWRASINTQAMGNDTVDAILAQAATEGTGRALAQWARGIGANAIDAYANRNDTVWEAMQESYFERYSKVQELYRKLRDAGDPAAYDKSVGAQPAMSGVELADLIKKRYPGRFDEAELAQVEGMTMPPMRIVQRQQMSKEAGERADARDAWFAFTKQWAPPGKPGSQFYDLPAVAALRDGPNPGAAQYQRALSAAKSWLRRTYAEALPVMREEWQSARAGNTDLQAMMLQTFGGTNVARLKQYWAYESADDKAGLRRQYPVLDKMLQFRQAYALQNPEYATYYQPGAVIRAERDAARAVAASNKSARDAFYAAYNQASSYAKTQMRRGNPELNALLALPSKTGVSAAQWQRALAGVSGWMDSNGNPARAPARAGRSGGGGGGGGGSVALPGVRAIPTVR